MAARGFWWPPDGGVSSSKGPHDQKLTNWLPVLSNDVTVETPAANSASEC